MRILVVSNLYPPVVRGGYEIECAENGAVAVEMAKANVPDLILMDISMPVMSGIEATRALRQIDGVNHVKIVALTAHAMESARRECMEAGCDDFATKPVDFARLEEVLSKPLPPTKSHS